MADAQVFDLDVVRAAYVAENPIEYRHLKLYGREWNVRPNPNIATLLSFADGGGTKGQFDFLLGYIEAEQREEFRQALADDEFFDEQMLETLTNFFTQQTTGLPTEESSTSALSSSATGQSLTDASLGTAPPVYTPSASEAGSTTP